MTDGTVRKPLEGISEIMLYHLFRHTAAEELQHLEALARLWEHAEKQRDSSSSTTDLKLLAVCSPTLAVSLWSIYSGWETYDIWTRLWMLPAAAAFVVGGMALTSFLFRRAHRNDAVRTLAAMATERNGIAKAFVDLKAEIDRFNAELRALISVTYVGPKVLEVPVGVEQGLRDRRAELVEAARALLQTEATDRYVRAVNRPGVPRTERFTQDLTRQVFALELQRGAEEAREAVQPHNRVIAAHDAEEEAAAAKPYEGLEEVAAPFDALGDAQKRFRAE